MHFFLRKKLNVFWLISISLLSGCTQKFNDSFSTLNASLDNYIDIELTPDELSSLPYDSAYVRLNDGKQVLMILALIEENKINQSQKLKWVSTDNLMIITENGRIIKTQGFEDDLINIQVSNDSKTNYLKAVAPQKSTLLYDWMPNYRYHFTANTITSEVGQESKQLQSWSLSSLHMKETITFIELSSKVTNHYWLNQNGKVISSIQYLGPNMSKIEISFVKDFIQQ